MPDRFWVGGAGTWDATTTTNWSATSGGSGGASAPTSVDSVFFDTLSNATAYAVTVGTNANALNVTIAGPAAGNVTITSGATAVINCFGSWTNAATGVVFTTTSGAALNFLSTTTGRTITTNNVTLGALAATLNGVGGGWTLGSAFTATAAFTFTNGTFSTANFAMTVASLTASGTATRSVSLGSSAISCSAATPINMAGVTNLTFNAGTSTITCTAASPVFNGGGGGGLTYNNVTFSSTATGTTTIQGANTFNVLTQAAIAAAGLRFVTLGANQTIATLTLNSAGTASLRTFVRSDTIGTQRTLTVATLSAISDIDFRDIVAAGASAASPWTGTRLGDCKNNSNITFTAAATKYWSTTSGASANWSNTNAWATTSGGTPGSATFPLAQDTVIIDDSGATTGDGLRTGNTVTIDANWNMGTLNFSGRTVAFNWTQGNFDPVIYGDVTLTATMTMTTVTGTPSWTFANQGTAQALNSAGVTLRLSSLIINSPGGGVTLTANTVVDLSPIVAPNVTGGVNLTAGTLSLGSNTLFCVAFDSSNSNVRTIAFGIALIVLTGSTGTIFTTGTTANLTVTGAPLVQAINGGAGTRTITFGTGALSEANAINFNITAGSDIVSFAGTGGAAKNVNFTGFTGTINIPNAKVIYGNWNSGSAIAFSGPGNVTFAATASNKTIRSGGLTWPAGVIFDGIGGDWDCQDALSVTGTLTLTNGTLNLAAGTTSTMAAFATSGANQKFLTSTVFGSQATISAASGTVTVSNLTIQDSNATGGAVWLAPFANNNVYGGNNTGWLFGTQYSSAVIEAATQTDSPACGNTIQMSVTESSNITDANSSAFLWNLIDNAQSPGWQDIETL